MHRWTKQFRDWYGHSLPDDYMTFDIESTGFSRKWDLPIDVGYCLVRGREVAATGNYLLNWTVYPGVEQDWLEGRIDKVISGMSKQGKAFPYSLQRLKEEGRDPYDVLRFYHELIIANREAGAAFVGHNAWSFDASMLTSCFSQVLGVDFEFGENELFDCGGMEKAIIAGDLEPFADEKTLKEYFSRICAAPRKGVFWNAEACIDRYNLLDKFESMGLDNLHTAVVGSYVSHLLFEELRRAFAD